MEPNTSACWEILQISQKCVKYIEICMSSLNCHAVN